MAIIILGMLVGWLLCCCALTVDATRPAAPRPARAPRQSHRVASTIQEAVPVTPLLSRQLE